MLLEGLSTLLLRLGSDIASIGCETDFAVDDDSSFVGVADDDIGAQTSPILTCRDDCTRLVT